MARFFLRHNQICWNRRLHLVTAAPKVQIVIPVHDRKEITRACLERLVRLDVPAWAGVIVVDDGSTDGTGRMIETEHPWVRLLRGDGRLWWTGAIVAGMRAAIEKGAECVIWLNDDTLPDPGALEVLARQAETSGGICGAVCRGEKDHSVAYGGGMIMNHWPRPLRQVEGQTPLLVDWLHGNLVAIPKVVWQRCGLPDAAAMPHNLADISYSFQARQTGISVWLHPAATALAQTNDSASYWSWLDPRLKPWDLVSGLWRVKMWWYAPGVFVFQLRHFGWQGMSPLVRHHIRLAGAVLLQTVLPRSLIRSLKEVPGCR